MTNTCRNATVSPVVVADCYREMSHSCRSGQVTKSGHGPAPGRRAHYLGTMLSEVIADHLAVTRVTG
jgi:hypothetical protein